MAIRFITPSGTKRCGLPERSAFKPQSLPIHIGQRLRSEPPLVRGAPHASAPGVKRPLFFSSWPFALIAASDDLKRLPSCSTGPRPP